MQAACPKVFLEPLQLRFCVQLHYHFASQFLIESLNSLGFGASYKHVRQFHQSIAVYEGTDIPEFNGQFVQYAADNLDHNICTLDGKHTFHGIVAAFTPSSNHTNCVPRRKVKVRKLSEAGKIKVHYCKGSLTKEVCELGILPSAGSGIRQLGIDFRESKESR